jgi:hypothetical protein
VPPPADGSLAAAPLARPETVIDKIPFSAAVVVQLGCGDGTALASFRQRNPATRLIGTEADPALAWRAAAVLDQAYCLAPDPGPLPALPPADCILLSPGMLDATAQPALLLAELAAGLAPGGVLVVFMAHGDIAAQHGLVDAAGLHALDAEQLRLAPGDGPHTHIAWRLSSQPIPPLRVFSTMLPPVGGVSQVRVVEPLVALAAEPALLTGITNHFDALPDPEGSDGIFVLHRPALVGEDGLAQVRALIARGWLVVCEFDDHPSQIPVLHRSDVWNFRAVHAIQTTTPALAEVFARENPEVAVFPNAVHHLPDPANFAGADDADAGLTLLFAALNREEDWPGHIDALNAAAAAAGPALRFHVIADRAFFDALETPHKQFTPLCDYTTYLNILAGCDISFMPLRDTLFNRCKSDLKYLEAASRRVVALASPTVYAASIRDGANGLIFDSPAGLYERLMLLVADPAAARALADRGRADVAARRMLAYQVRARARWYRDLWSRREALHQALLRRVPELG